MSFYNTGNLPNFNIQADDQYASQKIDFLQAGFNQPPAGTSLNVATSATAYTYSAAQITSAGYITRKSAGVGLTDVLPSASSLVAALNANQTIRQLSTSSSPIVVADGFSGNLIINNTSANAITLGSVTVSAGINVLKFIITNAASGSEAYSLVKLA
jgi:hypothetical protein